MQIGLDVPLKRENLSVPGWEMQIQRCSYFNEKMKIQDISVSELRKFPKRVIVGSISREITETKDKKLPDGKNSMGKPAFRRLTKVIHCLLFLKFEQTGLPEKIKPSKVCKKYCKKLRLAIKIT
ncbi:MAG: hypothetical protein J6O50_07170 [Ruminiclostridium sp.]|nr:hypothetical protein [Ruminiclostridium sp.]